MATLAPALIDPPLHARPAAPLAVGLIGYGYWGPNLARNFAAHPDAQLAMIADQSPRRLEAAHAAYSWSRLT
ncbi:MAG: hypothetical protein ACKVT1_00405, partial [Dehalococcoidia bacterium]